MIRIENLSKSYKEANKEIKVLEDLSIEINDSSKNLILGSSGSGKSTFLNLISAIDSPDQGKIIIDGLEISSLKSEEQTLFRRKNVGFIFQFFNLIPTLTVEENIFLPLELNGLLEKEHRDFALSLLDKVGLLDRKDSYPDHLSGGQQQRVAIVRALVHKPKIIVADEPTGNLDTETADKIIGIISSLLEETNAILVMATHDKKLCQIADKVFSVKDKQLELLEV